MLTFFNNKGGVGKTTLVYHIAYMLGELGEKVLVVDLDPQANLTAMFLDEKLEQLWENGQSNQNTILGAIQPLIKGLGDIKEVHLEKINDKIALIVGDLGLSSFEDKLSDAWIKCSDGDESAFRIVSAFYRIIQKAAKKHNASTVFIDVGPNLGAINRSTLIGSDFIITPVAPDLYSVQGLMNLGPALNKWRRLWQERVEKNPEPTLNLPVGKMQPKGYIVLQHGARSNRPVKAFLKWANRIPNVYKKYVLKENILQNTILPIENDRNCLGLLKHYQSLMSMEARKPIFSLKPSDGAIGAHYSAVRKSYHDFHALTIKIMDVCTDKVI